VLASALERWADVLTQTCQATLDRLGIDLRTGPGTGASGGLGAGLAAVCGAVLRPRFEVLLDDGLSGIDLTTAVARADLVITAEGAVDAQTPHGKVPAEVARRAKRHSKPVIALAGSIGEGAHAVHDIGIDAIAGIIPIPVDLATAVDRADALVADAVERTLRLFLLGVSFAGAGATRRDGQP